MDNIQQATKWQAQTIDGGKFTGGTGDIVDVNVAVVPVDLIKSFAVSSTNNATTLLMFNGSELWYQNGKRFTPTFPLMYKLADSTILVIERNSTKQGDLTFNQQ